MPELPEVETAVQVLNQRMVGHAIHEVQFPGRVGRMLNVPAETVQQTLSGQQICQFSRRAKYLIIQLERNALVIHQMLTGHLFIETQPTEPPEGGSLRARFMLSNGEELRFTDPRRFGKITLCTEPAQVLRNLGPEPLDDSFTLEMFRQRINGEMGVLKPLIVDQAFIAGIGNVYADEILHYAGLHPLRNADSLSAAEVERLHGAIKHILSQAVAQEGMGGKNYRKPDGTRGTAHLHLRAYRDSENRDKPCPVCNSAITRIDLNGRNTHFCPKCQPRQPA